MFDFKLKVALLIIIAALGMALLGCKKEGLMDQGSPIENASGILFDRQPSTQGSSYSERGSIADEAIVLGNIINDPYKVENMQAAYDNINDGTAPIASIKANYRYVRILPANKEQLNAIESDTSLVLFDYPLHYEILVYGTYYHDPSVADADQTWLYCVVPSDYHFPSGINEELIYHVYIPPTSAKGDFYDRLEEEAYNVAGCDDDNDGAKASTASWWTPSATIRAWDDVVNGYIVLQGVKVRARRGTKVGVGITDSQGRCKVDRDFKKDVYYSIKWESGRWDIRNGSLGQAYYHENKKMHSHWDFYIANNGSSILYASVHRAAYKFFYGNRLGLKSPALPYGKTKIGVYNRNPWWGSGCCWGTWSLLGIIPDIRVAHSHTTPTSEVFATAIHELGHQSHLLFIGKGTYIQLAKEIHESWAAAVECILTNHHYNTELANYGERCQLYNQYCPYQLWTPQNKPKKTDCYTPIFIDLIDNYNQRNGGTCGYYFEGNNFTKKDIPANPARPNDIISGYSISYIQNNILSSAYGLSSLNTALKSHKIYGVTDQMIDNHMALYWNRIYSRNPD